MNATGIDVAVCMVVATACIAFLAWYLRKLP